MAHVDHSLVEWGDVSEEDESTCVFNLEVSTIGRITLVWLTGR